MLAHLFGKYKTLVVSIALFLLLDATVLMVNFYTSFQIANDAKTINLAGRQRMLSQRMVKSLYEVDQSLAEGQFPKSQLAELALSAQMFEETLLALDEGGMAKGSSGEPQRLEAVGPGAGRDALLAAKELWRSYSPLVSAINKATSSEALVPSVAAAVAFARSNNANLLNYMNLLTQDIERVASAKANQLRTIQLIAIFLAVANFILILRHFLGHLRLSDKALESAREETTNILETVNEGLFLLDKDLRIGTQYSAKLHEMFFHGQQDVNIGNCLFSDFLRDRIKPDDLETAQRFISLLFRKNVKSNLIGDLNPLKRVEINIAEDEGGYTTKYMHFDFRRVMTEDTIKQVLVTVTDITREVLLSKELDESKAENAQQIEMLTGILHANPHVLKVFIQNAFDTLGRINELFKIQDKTTHALERKLKDVFVEVHNFKAEAASLSLATVVGLAHEMESSIKQLLGQPMLTGTDLLAPVVLLEKLIAYMESIQALAEKVASLTLLAPNSVQKPNNSTGRWHHLQEMAQLLAQRHDKKVAVHLTGFNELELAPEQSRLINDMCLQFIRNAVIHGIEKPEIRRLNNKPEVGRIDLSLIQLQDGTLEVNVRDDGAGVDYEKIRNKALSLGLGTDEELKHWSQKQLVGLIFKAGFSTADDLTDDAGRGVGMDVIVSRIQYMKGNIRLNSRKGKACQFVVTLPKMQTERAAA
ncbi:MAG TPA: type IV pili methyl-accepting chemotaxis transducer N-terminal domain-containing protein [Cellvibrionaceae bacterium]|nr:type IV pili methyl-accepting chemotaxis transducer N-terminal domain-containing protein [Cellvibrionaceae bacterium]HNG61367.1 type IV pili methyl-accepting chemotaxis transducer N-terminal domain-containing protein [Cellvibrionaceae bacterium]